MQKNLRTESQSADFSMRPCRRSSFSGTLYRTEQKRAQPSASFRSKFIRNRIMPSSARMKSAVRFNMVPRLKAHWFVYCYSTFGRLCQCIFRNYFYDSKILLIGLSCNVWFSKGTCPKTLQHSPTILVVLKYMCLLSGLYICFFRVNICKKVLTKQ